MGAKWILRLVLASVFVLAVITLSGCGKLSLKSVWRDRDVEIDGVPAEWRGTTTYVENPNIAIGVMNDAEYLYISLSSPVADIARQIVMRGLTVWFDPDGGKHRAFGIHCPIGTPMGPEDFREMVKSDRDRKAPREAFPDNLKGSMESLEILGPEEDDRVMLSSAEMHGIAVALGRQDGRFVYELRVPLQPGEDRPYAIGADEGQPIGIGFETPEIDREALREAVGDRGGDMPEGDMPGGMPDDGGPGGGMGPRGGMRPDGPGGRGPGQIPKPLEIWGKIQLAPPGGEGY